MEDSTPARITTRPTASLSRYVAFSTLISSAVVAYADVVFVRMQIEIDLGVGSKTSQVLGIDLTHEYVAINADYRS